MKKAAAQGLADWVAGAIREHEPGLLRYALRITGDADLARDVSQDVFLRLCTESRADLNGRLRPWLYRVCRNRALELRRNRGRTVNRSCGTDGLVAGSADDPARAAEKAETGSRVLSLVAELPPNQQEVIRLRFDHGLRYREIADVLDMTVSHVGVLIHTAIKTLRARLGE